MRIELGHKASPKAGKRNPTQVRASPPKPKPSEPKESPKASPKSHPKASKPTPRQSINRKAIKAV